jgi:hypothetical protein
VSGPPSHLDLLAAARALRRAAVDGDPDIVHAELWRLRTQVMQHHHAEHDPVSSLTGALGQPVRDGQQRLLRVLGELLFGVEADDDTCTGIVRAAGRSSCCSAGRPSSKPLHSALDRAIGREPEDRVHRCLSGTSSTGATWPAASPTPVARPRTDRSGPLARADYF